MEMKAQYAILVVLICYSEVKVFGETNGASHEGPNNGNLANKIDINGRARKTRRCENVLECAFGLETKIAKRSRNWLGFGAPGTSDDSLDSSLDISPDWHSCPRIYCPMDMFIPEPCRRSNYVLSVDGVTRCRVCDSSTCGYENLCPPRGPCPDDERIPEGCRVPRYTFAIDGQTRCRLCDESSCGYTKPT